MKDNRFENIAKMVSERVGGFSKVIANESANQQPFGVEKKDPIDKVYIYDKLDDSMRLALIQKHGQDAFREFERDVQKIKQRRGLL
jgi:hypothetical protein